MVNQRISHKYHICLYMFIYIYVFEYLINMHVCLLIRHVHVELLEFRNFYTELKVCAEIVR